MQLLKEKQIIDCASGLTSLCGQSGHPKHVLDYIFLYPSYLSKTPNIDQHNHCYVVALVYGLFVEEFMRYHVPISAYTLLHSALPFHNNNTLRTF